MKSCDREIIAIIPSAPLRFPRMPGSLLRADKLDELARALNIKVCGNLSAPNLLKVGVGIPVQLIGKQLLHKSPTVFPRRQADGVNHD